MHSFLKQFIPDAKIDVERNNCILIPVSDEVPHALSELESHISEFHCHSFNVITEGLEESLLRLIIDYDEF